MIKLLKSLVDTVLLGRTKYSGTNPFFNIFHPQYLATKEHNEWLEQKSSFLKGRIVDFGCGGKPYKRYFLKADYTGVDIPANTLADIYVKDGYRLPEIDDHSINGILSTQVIEHVTDINLVIKEWDRMLKPGSYSIVTAPFLFNVHGYPYDYRRFTENGLKTLFEQFGFEVIESATFGGIGSMLVLGFHNWFEIQTGKLFLILRFVLAPLFLLYTPILNVLGLFLNSLDSTKAFYTNAGIILRKV